MRDMFEQMTFMAIASLLICGSSLAQNFQSLPNGWLGSMGFVSGTNFVTNVTDDTITQWHYDAAQFLATGPIVITEIYVRTLPSPANPLSAFNFPSFQVTCATALTDYRVGNHNPVFAANLSADATVVRSGPWVGGPAPASSGPTGAYVPLGMTTPFLYDPSIGNDFIIQIVKCGTTSTWGTVMDAASGGPGTVGGNRYFNNFTCSSPTQFSSNNEFVPIVRIDYETGGFLTASQTGPLVGDLRLSLANAPSTATSGRMLITAATNQPFGTGPTFGLFPDASTWWALTSVPLSTGNPFHFPLPSPLPQLFPSAPFLAAPGSLSALAGMTVDLRVLFLAPGTVLDSTSNLLRFQFQ